MCCCYYQQSTTINQVNTCVYDWVLVYSVICHTICHAIFPKTMWQVKWNIQPCNTTQWSKSLQNKLLQLQQKEEISFLTLCNCWRKLFCENFVRCMLSYMTQCLTQCTCYMLHLRLLQTQLHNRLHCITGFKPSSAFKKTTTEINNVCYKTHYSPAAFAVPNCV